MAIQMTSPHPNLLHPGWNSLSGTILEGGFELQELLEADQLRARFRVRVLGDRELNCVALLFAVEDAKAEQQVEVWSLTRQLRHPNVSAPLGAGRVQVDGAAAVYVVVRRAEESLDDVLRERALTVEEAKDVLLSLAKALEILHLNGLVHGCLGPSRVLAVGESIQVAAECVRAVQHTPVVHVFDPAYLAPESSGDNLTPATDLWCLGATLFEALMQKTWTDSLRDEASALPEPFATIVLRCLHTDPEGRASLGEVTALLRGELKPAPRVKVAVAGAATAIIVPEEVLLPREEPPAAPSFSEALKEPVQAERAEQSTPSVLGPLASLPGSVGGGATLGGGASLEELNAIGLGKGDEGTPDSAPAPFLVRSPGEQAPARTGLEDGSFRAGPASRRSFDQAIEAAAPLRRSSKAEQEEPATSLWVWVGLTLVVVLGLIWALRPKPVTPRTSSGTTAAATRPAPNGSEPGLAGGAAGKEGWQTRTLQPDGTALKSTAPLPSQATPAPVRPEAPRPGKAAAGVFSPASSNVWRVVAYTYSHREEAEKKVRAINAKHAGLHAAIYSPSGPSSLFLVVLGDWMSREQAGQVRRKAVSAGMPRDCYIQNYTR